MLAAELLFWAAAALLGYAYGFYPLATILFAPRPVPSPGGGPPPSPPSVTVIVAARDEEGAIGAKLENLLGLDYPPDRREVIVVSDGSNDRTNGIVRGFAGRGVTLLAFPSSRGKTAAQNAATARARGDVLVFTDANSLLDPNALRALIAPLADPTVGCVAGVLQYRADRSRPAGLGELLYWAFETRLKSGESAAGAMVGVNGALYAVPRRLYRDLPPTVQSDLVLPLRLRAAGYRVVSEPGAVCRETAYAEVWVSIAVKRRIVLRALTSMAADPSLLNPLRHPALAFRLLSHKLLRWLSPFLLGLLFVASGVLAASPFYRGVLIAQAGFYLVGGIGLGWELRRGRGFPARLPVYACAVILAAALAWCDFLRGKRIDSWAPERAR